MMLFLSAAHQGTCWFTGDVESDGLMAQVFLPH